jgi:hypothetical protein
MLHSFLRSFSAINYPRYAEPINEHTKSRSPEGLLELHLNRSVFCQGMKYALCLCWVLDAKHHGEALWFLVVLRLSVSTLQYIAAHAQRGVEDLIAPFSGHLVRNGRALVGHHERDFSAQALLVEFEGYLALTVEMQVRIQLHSTLLWLVKQKVVARETLHILLVKCK